MSIASARFGAEKTGDLRSRISFLQAAKTDDNAGGRSIVWSTIGSAWAALAPMAGNEALQADQLRAGIAYKVVTRYRTDITITSKLRVQYGARLFEILSVSDPGDKHDLYELLCAEILT